jgi:hypothetical protein
LAEIDILLAKLTVKIGAEDCIPLNLRAFKISFILIDIVCVLAQLAGTALTITFGNLVSIGQKAGLSQQYTMMLLNVQLVTVALWVQLVFFLSTVVLYTMLGYRVYVIEASVDSGAVLIEQPEYADRRMETATHLSDIILYPCFIPFHWTFLFPHACQSQFAMSFLY